MTRRPVSYLRHRFPPEIISHAVWLYHRFCLSFRDVEDLLAQRGVTVSYESIRQWCAKFGREYAKRLRRCEGRLGDTWYLDELVLTIGGRRQYLWRAVDQEGAVLDILVQPRRDARAAVRFFRKLLKGQGRAPARLVTDKLRSYGTAQQAVMASVVHDTRQYANNRAEVSHQPTRQRERQMRRFKSPAQAQRFLSVHGAIQNAFRMGRHFLRAVHPVVPAACLRCLGRGDARVGRRDDSPPARVSRCYAVQYRCCAVLPVAPRTPLMKSGRCSASGTTSCGGSWSVASSPRR